MTMNDARLRTRVLAWLAAAVCGLAPLAIASSVLVSSAPVGAQEDTRRLWDSAFLSKREPSKSKPRPRKAPEYRVATPPPAAPHACRHRGAWRARGRDGLASAAIAGVRQRRFASAGSGNGEPAHRERRMDAGARGSRDAVRRGRSRALEHRVAASGVSLRGRSRAVRRWHDERPLSDLPDPAHARWRQLGARRQGDRAAGQVRLQAHAAALGLSG